MFTHYKHLKQVHAFRIVVLNKDQSPIYVYPVLDLPTIRYFQNYYANNTSENENFKKNWLSKHTNCFDPQQGFIFSIQRISVINQDGKDQKINEETLFTSEITAR